jgi:hypothetical protein
MFDEEINSEYDLLTKYGEGANLSLVGDGRSYDQINVELKDHEGTPIENVFLGKNGTISVNGEKKNEYEYTTAHFSNLQNYTFGNSQHYNFFNSFYIGPNNPIIEGKDSYLLPPINYVDYAAMLHDKEYDSLELVGYEGVFSPKSINADYRLARNCYLASKYYESGTKEHSYALIVYRTFMWIYGFKLSDSTGFDW